MNCLTSSPRRALAACALAVLALASPPLQAQGAAGGEVLIAAVYGPVPEPVPVPGVKPVRVDALEALKTDGLYHLSGNRMVHLRVTGSDGPDRWTLAETAADGAAAFNDNIDVANFVRNGERRAVGRPTLALPADNGNVMLVYQGSDPFRMTVSLQAYDVGGMPISVFLRTAENWPRAEAAKAGSARFPEGAVAYLATVRFMDEVLMLPRKESFTGARTTAEFVRNFSQQVPYCLSYEDRQGAKPYAMLFSGTGQGGQVRLYPAKTGTLFCAREGAQPIGEGKWEERTVGGTRAVVVTFAQGVDPLDTGVTAAERDAARIAFVEPTRGTMGVRPGKIYSAGARIVDYQYRFNKAAADAVRDITGIQ